MFGEDYAWVLSGAPQDSWWRDTAGTNCSRAQLVKAVQGVVLVTAHGSIIGTNASESGLTNRQFLLEFSRTGQPLTEYVTQTYDAVWAIALALSQMMERSEVVEGRSGSHRRHLQHATTRREVKYPPRPIRREVNSAWVTRVNTPPRKPDKEDQKCSSSLHQQPGSSTKPTMSWILGRLARLQEPAESPGQRRPGPGGRQGIHHSPGLHTADSATFQLDAFDYAREDMADKILETMQGLRFRGVSGPISFDCPDRVGVTAFYQIQEGDPVKVALYHPEEAALDLECPGCQALVWPGGEVPASRVFKVRVDTIAPAAFVIMSALASLGILLALAFLIFNLTYRRLKYIKLSSPRLNNTTVVGCVLVYTAVILLGLDHATLPAPHCFPVICTARAYLLSAGFSLAFGSMFTKTYRVHQIFTRSNSAGVVRNKLLKDKQLITVIMVLLAVDVVIVSAWVTVDPMTRHLHNLTLEISAGHRGVVYQPQVEVCRSVHTSGWLGALYVYKGLLVAVGVYMAWETRHVKIPALNDSQYIGMSVYNVVITSIIVIVAANIIGERTTLAYVIITTLIFTSTTTTLCLLFIPKILTIIRRAEGDPIVESMGLKIQSNTRRLLTEDKREKYYRAEVQNKVYRREVVKLDQELHKLHRWLEAPDSPSSSTRSLDLTMKKV
nr:gamma-aminobutyric acid type B receptor subunit 2-like [Procambarus clarkii]